MMHGLEAARRRVNGSASRRGRAALGQFFTPAAVAGFMASLFEKPCRRVRILDAGAGMGALSAALVEKLLARSEDGERQADEKRPAGAEREEGEGGSRRAVVRPDSIEVVAYETDAAMMARLEETLAMCGAACCERGVAFKGTIRRADFIADAIARTDDGLLGAAVKATDSVGPAPASGGPAAGRDSAACDSEAGLFTHAILNPPYKKINGETATREMLNAAGLEVSNLYAAFVWLAARLLAPRGELVSITPRSFCNGPYFLRFRKGLLALVGLRRLHVFESRKAAFKEDNVLQENVILYGVRGERQRRRVVVSATQGPDFADLKSRSTPFERIVLPRDPDVFIHLPGAEGDDRVMERMAGFETTLEELGLEVSTGRVVDFRAREHLRQDPAKGAAPLLYPCHFADGFVRWPAPGRKKPNAIAISEATRDLLVASGCYVLTKRFSAKEERRRVVAAVCDPERVGGEWLGFENHLNYFHARGEGLSPALAKGLAMFLNSSLLDRQFRLFSGHTQVNATDLRKLRYPSREQLLRMGSHVKDTMPEQGTIDEILEKECG
jgi:adenine-specific DNA-methyltransferase